MGKVMDFVFNLDVSMNNGFSQSMRILNGEFSQLQQAAQRVNAKLGDIGAYQKLSGSVQTSSTRLEYLRSCYQSAAAGTESARQRTAQLAAQHEAAQKRVSTLSQTHSRHSMLLMFAKKREQELAAAYRQSEKETQKLTSERDKMYKKVGEAADKLEQEKRSLHEMGEALRAAGMDTDKLSEHQGKLQSALERTQKAQSKLSSIRETLSWGNVKQAFMMTAPVVNALKAPVKLAADFESAMARVKSVAFSMEGADLSEFEALKAQALQLGADTQFTAIQAANTQENLARAGMSTPDIKAAMPAVLDMAAAEGMDLAQAGSIIAKGLGGMNLEGKYAGRLADILAYASASSNTNIAMLGEAFKVAAPVFSSQGATMEQLASYLAVLANKGYEGSEAGNAIAAAPLRLAKQNKETRDTLAQLGVAVMTREGRLREIPDVMIALNQAMKDRNYGEAQQLNVIETLFGKNYGKAMMAFMQASAAGDTGRMQSGVQNNSFGQARKMAKINLDTLNGQLQILGSAWDGVRTTIGDMFSPIVREGVELLSSALSGLNDAMKRFPVEAQLLTYALTGLASAKAIKSIWNIGSALVQLPGAWLDVHRAASAAQTAVEGTAAATKLFGVNLYSALGLIGLIALASYEIYKHWDDITEAAKRAGEAIQSIDTNKYEQAKAGTLSRSDADYGTAVMTSTYMPPSIPQHAFGGIFTSPHIGMVAEAGAEAIIPLRNKSRGMPILNQAMNILGVKPELPSMPSLPKIGLSLPKIPSMPELGLSLPKIPSLPELTSSLPDLPSLPAMTSSLPTLKELTQNVTQAGNSILNNDTNTLRNGSMSFAPTYNITVSGEGSSGIAENIRQVIEDTMNDLMSRMERVSFA